MSDLSKFLDERLCVDNVKRQCDSDSPPWWEDGVTVEIDEGTYFRFLDLLPPRYVRGDLFAFGEGSGQFTLFWSQAGRYFAHQLSIDDTETFCRLTHVALHQ